MMTMNPTTKARFLLFGKFLLILVFAISFRQLPLYSSNQNTYFVHGLANAGVGHLNLDWLAQTTDPFPIFSALVSITVRVFDENAFYLYQIVIQGIYAYSILEIGSYVFRFDNLGIKYISYFALLAALYSGLLGRFLSELPVLWRFASVVDPNGLLTFGVAGQYILGPFFQPSAFGVFVALSIYAYLHDRPFVAIVCLAIAATFHSTYLLSAAVLTCTYIAVIVVKDNENRKALMLGTSALVLVIPILIYNYTSFIPTTADIYAQAQSILVDYRIPHHAIVTSWFSKGTLFQIIIVALSIYLVRRTKILPVLLVPFLAAIILTAAQWLTGNKTLSLLFPWRISVFLVPIASAIVIASIISVAFQLFQQSLSKNWLEQRPTQLVVRVLQAAILGGIILLGILGVSHTITLLKTPRVGVTASTRFIASTYQPGNLYLIPPDVEWFRLAARIPILVDFKSHPYKDTELIEWFNRVEITKNFYASSGDIACNILQDMSVKYEITHVISKSSITNCGMLHESYRDADFIIYEVQSR